MQGKRDSVCQEESINLILHVKRVARCIFVCKEAGKSRHKKVIKKKNVKTQDINKRVIITVATPLPLSWRLSWPQQAIG